MNRLKLMSAWLVCLVWLGACSAPEATTKEETQNNAKLERMERDFFDRGPRK